MQTTSRSVTVALLLAFACAALAQKQFAKIGQYSQFRNISGLAGGTLAVSPDGNPGAQGALSLSTPIGYSLRGGRFVGVLANNSYDSKPRMFAAARRKDFGVDSNGSAVGLAGISTDIGDFTVGMTVVSGSFENTYSAQFTPKGQSRRCTFAVGAQGLFAKGGFIGPGLHDDVDRESSFYGVATLDCGKGLFISGGWGTERFSQGFGNVSFGLGSRARATLEFDGFGWNYGIGVSLAEVRISKQRAIGVHAFGGMVQSRYAFISLGLSF